MKNRKTETREVAAGQEETDDGIMIPVLEEFVETGKTKVVRESIIIKKKVTEEEAEVDIPLTLENYVIQRVAKDQILDSKPGIREEGNTIIIPVVQEVVVKRIQLVEEIRLTRKSRVIRHKENLTVSKEEVIITKKGIDQE